MWNFCFSFGNKLEGGSIKEANGVIREFEISEEQGNICIPIGLTGFAARTIYETILKSPENYYENPDVILPFLKQLADESLSPSDALKQLNLLLKLLKNKNG